VSSPKIHVLAGPHAALFMMSFQNVKAQFQINSFYFLYEVLVEIMAECANSRCRELEKKLVRLNVTLNDKSESIDVLIKAIDDIEITSHQRIWRNRLKISARIRREVEVSNGGIEFAGKAMFRFGRE